MPKFKCIKKEIIVKIEPRNLQNTNARPSQLTLASKKRNTYILSALKKTGKLKQLSSKKNLALKLDSSKKKNIQQKKKNLKRAQNVKVQNTEKTIEASYKTEKRITRSTSKTQISNILTNESQKKITNIYHTRTVTKKIGKPIKTEFFRTKFTTNTKTKHENDQVSVINEIKQISQVKTIYDYESETGGKKVINNVDSVVADCLRSNVILMKNVKLLPEGNIIVSKEINQTKVSILCIGGFNYHPTPCQYVAKGMLTGAATGANFGISPNYEDIMKLIYNTNSSAGVL